MCQLAADGGWQRSAVGCWRLCLLAAVGGCRWAVGGGRRLMAVGGWWQSAVDGGCRLAAVGGWLLAVVAGCDGCDGWRLAADGGWQRLAVGCWRLWRVATVSGCRWAVGGSWRLMVVGSPRSAVVGWGAGGSIPSQYPPDPGVTGPVVRDFGPFEGIC